MSALLIEKLSQEHTVETCDCGNGNLNRFLSRFAWQGQQANASQTYLGLAGNRVIGFYTLVVGEVAYDGAPERMTKGMARHPVPVMLLARLGVDVGWQGKGIGAGLLRDAILRTLRAADIADIAGIRAIVVHAKDDAAAHFYRHFGFSGSPSDSLHLHVLIKALRNL